jgi:hypothetical protein
MRTPPRIPTILLESFCPPALAGDLSEEFQPRQSSWWYWRQALLAVLVCSLSDFRRSKVQTLGAVAIAWLGISAFFLLFPFVAAPLNRSVFEWVVFNGPRWLLLLWHFYIPAVPIGLTGCALAGFVAVRLTSGRSGAALLGTTLLLVTLPLVTVPHLLQLSSGSPASNLFFASTSYLVLAALPSLAWIGLIPMIGFAVLGGVVAGRGRRRADSLSKSWDTSR